MERGPAELYCMGWMLKYGYEPTRAGQKVVKLPGGRYTSQRADFWRCIDLIGVKRGERNLLLQVTTHAGASARRRKIERIPFDLDHNVVAVVAFEYDRSNKQWMARTWTRRPRSWYAEMRRVSVTPERARKIRLAWEKRRKNDG